MCKEESEVISSKVKEKSELDLFLLHNNRNKIGIWTVAQILIGINNENPESDIGVNIERSEK